MLGNQPVPSPIFGEVGHPCPEGLSRAAWRIGMTIQRHVAACCELGTEDCSSYVGASAAHESEQPDDLARPHVKGDI